MTTSDVRDHLQAALGDAYRIERELPPGGMSRLFLTTERSADRQVVIKLLPSEYAVPSSISVPRLRVDPSWARLGGHPRFEPLIAE